MDFNGMKRKKLQALCKKHKIPANLLNLQMVNLLSQLFKDGEKTTLHGNVKNNAENGTKIESSDTIVQRTVKKVRFSPENELFEFTRPAEPKRRSRRTSVLNRYGTTGLSIENVGHNGAALIGGYDKSQVSQSKVSAGGISNKKRGKRRAESFATVEDINEKRSMKGTMQSKKNALVDNAEKVGKEDSKSAAVAVKNAVDDENLVAEMDNIPGRLTRYGGKKLEEAYVTRETRKRRVVDNKVNVTSVSGGNDEKKAINRRSLRNGHAVGEAEHSRNFEEVCENNGEGQVKILKDNNVKVSVVGEPHVTLRRSRRIAGKHNSRGTFNDDVKKLENRGTRNQVDLNFSEVPAQIKRSIRNTSKCNVNYVAQELDVNPVTQPENKKRKRKMRNVLCEDATQSEIDLSSGKPSEELQTMNEETALLHDDILDARETSPHENSRVSVSKPTQSVAKNDITEYHGKGEAASDVSENADEVKADYMNGEIEKVPSSLSDIHKDPPSELNVQESIEQVVSGRDQNKRDHIVFRQPENSTSDNLMNNMGPSGSLQVSLNADFADSNSFTAGPLPDELPDFEANAEVAVVKAAKPSLQMIDHVRELEGLLIQQNQDFVEVEHSSEKSISSACHHNDLDQVQASAKISEDTARTSTAGEAGGLETYENFNHSVVSNSVLEAKNSASYMPRNNSDGDNNIAETYETYSPKGINTKSAKTDDGRSKKNHNVASDKNSAFNVTDLFDDITSAGIISQKAGFSADECSFVDLVSDTIIDRDTHLGSGKIDGLLLEDQNAEPDGGRDLRISDLRFDEIQTQTLLERGEFTGDISTNSFEEKERSKELFGSAPIVEVKLKIGNEAGKIVEDGRTDDQIKAETEISDDVEKGHLADDQIRTDVERGFSIANLFRIEEVTEITYDVRISSLEVSLKNSDVPHSFSAESNFRTVRPSSQEKVNLKTSNPLKFQEDVVGGIIQVKEVEIQAEARGDEISKEKPFSVKENGTLDGADVSNRKDTVPGITIGTEPVVGIMRVKEVKIQTDANGDEVSKDNTVSVEIIENLNQGDLFGTEEPGCGTTIKSEAVFAGIIQGKEVKILKDESGDEIIEGASVSSEEREILNQAGVCTQNDTEEPEARVKNPLSTPIDMAICLQMEEAVFRGILRAHNSISAIETNGNAGSSEVVEGSVSYKDEQNSSLAADHVKTSNDKTELIPDSLVATTISEAYATAETEDKNFSEASFEEVKETGTKCDGNGVTVTDSDEECTDMEPSQNCSENELCNLLGTIVDCVAHSVSNNTCSQGSEVANMTLSARKSTSSFCISFEKVEIEGESGSDCPVETCRDVILSDTINQVFHTGWDEDLEGSQLKLLFSTPMKSMTPNEVFRNSAKSDENLGDAATHSHASALKMPASECDEVLKETDVADTIKEYIDCEPFVSTNSDDSSRDLNLSVEAPNYIDETTSDNKSHLDVLPEEDINVGLQNFERDEDKLIEGRELEQAILLMESEPDRNKVSESPTCVDPLFKEGSDVKDTETSKKETEPEESNKPSSRHLYSISKNNSRTIVIHGTPSEVVDMKENPSKTKSSLVGDLTAIRPAKRNALQDLQWK